ncbi:MAG: hypothetical protein EOM90_05670 [Alphaproteobacteria bacterium]|nr:hypothetical protein [Alphaproteobacteria bacterium]
MKSFPLFLIFLIVCSLIGYSQKQDAKSFKIVFYNTENIFDTIDDPTRNDEDFLPGSKVAWTSERYNRKLQQVARVLSAIDSTDLPAFIGLAEIENKTVLEDLIRVQELQRGGYQTILVEGNDPRGIDVAALYRPGKLSLAGYKSLPLAASFQTRSALYIKVLDQQRNTFHIFINHWKSREGSAEKTEPKRVENATFLKQYIDSVQHADPQARIILMGDFNDEPVNKSISEVLKAQKIEKRIKPASLYNLTYENYAKGEGTLFYKDWDLFDQIIVSGNLLTGKRHNPVIHPPYAYIFKKEWMLYKNKSGQMIPNRTAGSKEYFGGFSDHLPVYVVVE